MNVASAVFLAGAIVAEVAGTLSMKLSHGFTKLWPSVTMGVCYIISLTLLTYALKRIDVSTAYAIWGGVGTALIVTAGTLWFKEPMTALKLISIGLIIAGVIGLNLAGGAH